MLLDELVNRQVQHVVFDSQVTARSVNLKSLLVVHNNNFSGELASQLTVGGFKRNIGFNVIDNLSLTV